MATDSNVHDARARLAELGAQREARTAEDKVLHKEIVDALREAINQGVPKAESARLLKMERSTLYRVYDPS